MFSLWDRSHCVAQADLELHVFCLCVLSAGITSLYKTPNCMILTISFGMVLDFVWVHNPSWVKVYFCLYKYNYSIICKSVALNDRFLLDLDFCQKSFECVCVDLRIILAFLKQSPVSKIARNPLAVAIFHPNFQWVVVTVKSYRLRLKRISLTYSGVADVNLSLHFLVHNWNNTTSPTVFCWAHRTRWGSEWSHV